MIWNDLNEIIAKNSSFLISSHQSLDGDCVGSQLAFYWYLKSLGKTVCIYDQDPLPSKFSFLQDSDAIKQVLPDDIFDVYVILDSSNPARLGWGDEFFRRAKSIINIDHHRDNFRAGTVNCVDTSAAATGEIIYGFFIDNGIDFPSYVAETLYTAIMTDTGGFRFSNTNSKVLKICSDLADRGAHCSKIFERVYASLSPQALMLQSRIWSTLTYYFDKKVCTMEMPLSMLDEVGAVYSDSEGMSDHTIISTSVEVGLMIKYNHKQAHFSLRSKGRIDVGKIAQQIPGGGGHGSAAGCTLELPFPEALQKMLSLIEKELP